MASRPAVGLERMVLATLSRDIEVHPETLRPVSAPIIDQLRHLVAGVDVDLERPLPTGLGDAGMP